MVIEHPTLMPQASNSMQKRNRLEFQSFLIHSTVGLNKSIIGGLANLIKKKRIPDIYKGKGVYYKNEKILLKSVKKS